MSRGGRGGRTVQVEPLDERLGELGGSRGEQDDLELPGYGIDEGEDDTNTSLGSGNEDEEEEADGSDGSDHGRGESGLPAG